MIKRLTAGWLLVLALVGGAHAAPLLFTTTLSGPAEAPPNNSPGTGFARVLFDPDADTMRVIAQWEGLLGTTTVAHIHCCTAEPFTGTVPPATGVPTFPGFPVGVTSGTYDQTFDMDLAANWNPAFVAAAGGIEQAQEVFLQGLQSGRAYFNIHTNLFMPGEIRGFFVPEPSSLALLAMAAIAVGALRRRRR